MERIAEGREAEIFAWEPGTVLKLYRSTSSATEAEWEAAATDAVTSVGGPGPGSHGLVTIEGRPGLVLDRIDGPDLVTAMGRRPWTVPSLGTVMGEAHAAIHSITAPTSLPSVRLRLERRVREAEVPARWRDSALRTLEGLPDGERLCHNDLHPQNVLLSEREAVVIDWPAATSGDPAADVARTLLLFRAGKPLPSAPLRVRLLAAPATGIFRRRYLTAYRAAAGLDDDRVRAWLLPQAVSRTVEAIPGEQERLARLVESLLPTDTASR